MNNKKSAAVLVTLFALSSSVALCHLNNEEETENRDENLNQVMQQEHNDHQSDLNFEQKRIQEFEENNKKDDGQLTVMSEEEIVWVNWGRLDSTQKKKFVLCKVRNSLVVIGSTLICAVSLSKFLG